MAAWAIRKIDVAETTAAGSKTYTVSSQPTGLTAKGAIVVLTASGAADSITTPKRISVGMYDGTNQRAVCDYGENNVATASADTGVRFDTATVAQFTATGNLGLGAEGAATALGTDSISITWDSAIAVVGQIYLFYGDVFACAVEDITSSAVINTVSTSTALGTTPDGIIAVSVGQAFVADGQSAPGMLSVGFSGRLPSITQACTTSCAENRKATSTSAGCETHNDRVSVQLTSTAGVVSEGQTLEVTAYNSTGFDLTTRSTGALGVMLFSFKIGARVWAGAPTLPASTSGSFSRTDPGFRPIALFIAGTRVGNINTINSGAGQLCIGGACASGNGIGTSFWRDNQATSSAGCTSSATDIIRIPSTAAVDDWRATFTSFDATGWTGNVTTATTTPGDDRPTAYMAIEEVPLLFGNDTETLSDGFVALFTAAVSANAETETIADGTAFMLAQASADTETISDGAVFVVTTLAFPSADTETIDDSFAALAAAPVSFSDTETITDDFVAVTVSAGDLLFVDGDTETIDDGLRFSLTGTLLGNDTETITDTPFLYLGTVFSSGDTETITDGAVLVTAAGFRGINRGTLMGAGAEAGFTYGAGVARGEVDG
jgi:hypothetical protein